MIRRFVDCRPAICLLVVMFLVGIGHAQEQSDAEPAQEVLATTKWQILHLQKRAVVRPLPVPEDSPLKPLATLSFKGPQPGHPFVLGDYSADADWKIANGYLSPTGGKNAALQVAYADQFELDGIMAHAGSGGWFFLVGWDDGRGFAIHNVRMMTEQSGSPWFLTSFRGNEAIEGETEEFPFFDWKGEQPFSLTVQDEAFTLRVGDKLVFEGQPLNGYAPGAVIIGTYDTRYGPKKIGIKSLRVRAIEKK